MTDVSCLRKMQITLASPQVWLQKVPMTLPANPPPAASPTSWWEAAGSSDAKLMFARQHEGGFGRQDMKTPGPQLWLFPVPHLQPAYHLWSHQRGPGVPGQAKLCVKFRVPLGNLAADAGAGSRGWVASIWSQPGDRYSLCCSWPCWGKFSVCLPPPRHQPQKQVTAVSASPLRGYLATTTKGLSRKIHPHLSSLEIPVLAGAVWQGQKSQMALGSEPDPAPGDCTFFIGCV